MKVTPWKHLVGASAQVDVAEANIASVTPFDLTGPGGKQAGTGSSLNMKDGKRLVVQESPDKFGHKANPPTPAASDPAE